MTFERQNARLILGALAIVAVALAYFWPRLNEQERQIIAAYAQSYEVNSGNPDARRTDCQGRRSDEAWAALELTCERNGEVVARAFIGEDGALAASPVADAFRGMFDDVRVFVESDLDGLQPREALPPEQ